MAVGPNPAISAEAVRRALGAPEAEAAHQYDVAAEQANLDEAELREVEHADYYPYSAPASGPEAAPQHRTWLDRLFRRDSR